MRLLSTLNHNEKLMRLQNSASHVVCHEKFSFIILSIALSAHPRLHILVCTSLPLPQAGPAAAVQVFVWSQPDTKGSDPSQNSVPEPVWMQFALSTLVVPNVLVKSCLLSFVLKKKEMKWKGKSK